jgi:cell division protein FtsB
MWTRHHRKRRTGALVVPALAACFLTYFGFHAYNGDYGINAKYRLEERIGGLERQVAGLKQKRAELERKVQLLHDGTVERDMLDEHARRVLNYAHPDDVVILRSDLLD